jgi:Fungal specific transcription factor domain
MEGLVWSDPLRPVVPVFPDKMSDIQLKDHYSGLLERSISGMDQQRVFLTEHYFQNVASIFTIFDGPKNPFGEELRQYLSAKGVLSDVIISIAAVQIADINDDSTMLNFAFQIRAQALEALGRALERPSGGLESFVGALMLSISEVSRKNSLSTQRYI